MEYSSITDHFLQIKRLHRCRYINRQRNMAFMGFNVQSPPIIFLGKVCVAVNSVAKDFSKHFITTSLCLFHYDITFSSSCRISELSNNLKKAHMPKKEK